MNALQNLYAKLRESARYRTDLENAQKAFSFQPFAVEFRPILQAAIYGRWLLAVFSVATGYFALYEPFAGTLPIWLAACLAGLLLVGIEACKSLFSGLAFRQFYRTGGFPLPGVFAAACLGLSVWLSLSGVQSLYSQLDESSENLSIAYKTKSDSISHAYDMGIQEAKIDAQSYFNSNNHQGTITYTRDGSIAKQYARLKDRVLELEAEKREALHVLIMAQEQANYDLAEKTGFNVVFWTVLSGCNELLILLANWFVIYYQYRIYRDAEMITDFQENFTVSMPDLKSFAELVLLSGTQYLPGASLSEENKPSIGFKPPQQNQENLLGNQENRHSVNTKPHSVQSHAGLIADIKSGITDYRTLLKKHSVNVATVKKYMERYAKKVNS